MSRWYSRPVLFVADVARSVDFYAGKLGLHEAWRHEDDGRLLVAQVDRDGCEIILTCQWPDKNGHGLIFVSLDDSAIDTLRAEFEAKGVNVQDAHWGYKLMTVSDPDGNQLFFPYPAETPRD